MGLARISRWGGASRWHEPLAVAQHEPARRADSRAGLGSAAREAMRQLLHDASEGLIGWDLISPLKPRLGEPFRKLEQRPQALVRERYALPAWDAAAYRRHKAADRLAAASETCHVVGWSREDMRDALGIVCEPLEDDPLPMPEWEAVMASPPADIIPSAWDALASRLTPA